MPSLPGLPNLDRNLGSYPGKGGEGGCAVRTRWPHCEPLVGPSKECFWPPAVSHMQRCSVKSSLPSRVCWSIGDDDVFSRLCGDCMVVLKTSSSLARVLMRVTMASLVPPYGLHIVC